MHQQQSQPQRLIVRRSCSGGDVTPDQVARVAAALDAELAVSPFTYLDAMLAWDETVYRGEMEADICALTQDQSLLEEEDRFELTEADRQLIATPIEQLAPWEPHHDEREALYFRLQRVADAAAGERVYFFKIDEGDDPARYL